MTQETKPEALRLADELQQLVQTYPQLSEDEAGGYMTEQDQIMDYAAAELRHLDAAEQAHMRELRAYRLTVENLEKQINDMRSVSDEMVDAALEAYIQHGDMRFAIEAAIASVSR